MASMFCNSALRVVSRSLTNRFRTFVQKSLIPSLFSSPSSAGITHASRILSEIGSVESTMPLHSAIANARLTSNMACYSTSWSMLSQEGKKKDGKLNSVLVNLLEKPKHDIEDSIAFVREIIEEKKKEFIELSMIDGLCDLPKPSKQLRLTCLNVFQLFK
ncbi:uncharacterized protein LOC130743746 [Lotus japonicus]|uniref:uncharacterized protein LOC130743746 n=1 Tax=Lotus japonicus TaxID=34305 RepID=UPI00258B69EB|nr:uncharacterized protein LOC130743746 [Lotus japonicus]